MSGVPAECAENVECCPSEQEVRQELRTLLGRDEFRVSDRNRRFLTYIVEETLQGRADSIKAYSIAVAAFDRSDDFDPLTDPIVRIEAGHLRRSLEHYYLTAGKTDPVRIDMPKGSYVAKFRYLDLNSGAEAHSPTAMPSVKPTADEAPATQARAPAPSSKSPTFFPRGGLNPWVWTVTALVAVVAVQVIANAWKHYENGDARAVMRGPSVAVVPFENVGTQPNLAFVARGLTLEVVTSLTRFSDLFVYGPEVLPAASRRGPDDPVPPATDASYVLSGSVYSSGEMVRVSAILIDARTSRSVWSANFNRDLSTASLLSIQSDIAEHVANAVGQPYGAVFNLTAEEVAAKPIASLRSYECVIRFRQLWRDYDQREYADMRDCLEQTIKADPGYARAYASLALLDMDSVRFGFGRDVATVDPLQEAFELSRRALELNPNESDAYLALSMAYWFSRDFDASVIAAKRGLAADPHNADLMVELGFRYAFMGKWDLSRPLIAEAFARNPALPSGYRIANFLYYYMQGDFRSALHEALQVKARYVLYGHLARAAVYGKLGDAENAKAPLAELLQIDPHYGDHVEADLARRAVSPVIIHELVDGLVKAGLPVPPPPTGG